MAKRKTKEIAASTVHHLRPSAEIDTRVIYCGDCLDQLQKLPDARDVRARRARGRRAVEPWPTAHAEPHNLRRL
ncbi:MAG TPA: hypothetical protein VMV94_12155 [Phycisphaerae bacterium]|nr:hypothetical protein [Phycisphaerae bacterium]